MPLIPCILKKPFPWMSTVVLLLASVFIGYGFSSIILASILTLSSLIFNFSNHKPNPETVEELVQERDISTQNVASELLQEQVLKEEHGGRTSEGDKGDIFRDNSNEEGEISDEDSLIEISLPSGVYIDQYREQEKKKKLADDLEFLKKQMSLMELLAELNEMNEEDNLIEIDLSIGSIKCAPRLEIHA